jgi:hypothetical protein
MFITSRESAIVFVPEKRFHVYSGGLSISQPPFTAGQSEIQRFAGFFMVFLESNQNGIADGVYILWFGGFSNRYVVVLVPECPATSRKRNQSTIDGTKVVERAGIRRMISFNFSVLENCRSTGTAVTWISTFTLPTRGSLPFSASPIPRSKVFTLSPMNCR